jgi:hypothetical protein
LLDPPAATATSAPPLEPSNTATATEVIPTVTPAPSATPTATLSPTAGTPTPTATPFPITLEPETPTPTPEGLPLAAIQLFAPGPLSRLASPIRVQGYLVPGAGNRIRLELLGEDGRLLVRKLLVYPALPKSRVTLVEEIDFQIAAVAETARLSLSVDDIYGRVTDLASVEVILLSSGDSDLNPSGDLLAPIVVEEPVAEDEVSGGELLVTGLARPSGDQPLMIELISREGKVLGSRMAAVAPGDPGEHRPFAAAVPYQVSASTWALLVVRERGQRIPGTAQLVSLEILLRP